MFDFFKHIFQFFFCPKSFIKSSLKRVPNPSKELPEQFRQSTEKLKKHIFRALRFVLCTILIAVVFYLLTLYFDVKIPFWFVITLRLTGYCLILWGILSYLGYPIRTCNGETLPEIFDEEWHKFLYGGGLFLLLFSYLSELPLGGAHAITLSSGNMNPVFVRATQFLKSVMVALPKLTGNINWQFVTGISTAFIAYFAYAINRDTNKPEIGLFFDNEKKQLTLKNFGNLPAQDVFLIYRHIEINQPVKISVYGRSGGDLVFGKEEIGMTPISVADLTQYPQFLVCVWRYRYKRKTVLRERVFVRLSDYPNWVTTIETFVSKREWKIVEEQLTDIKDKFPTISTTIRD